MAAKMSRAERMYECMTVRAHGCVRLWLEDGGVRGEVDYPGGDKRLASVLLCVGQLR